MSPVGHSQAASTDDAAMSGRSSGPSALLRAAAASAPDAPAFLAPAGRMAATGRGGVHLDFLQADRQVDRIATIFRGLGLPPGALFGVSLLAGPEACLAIIALERAGLTPCLLPVAWEPERLKSVAEALGIAGVVTQTRAGGIRLAEDWRDVAMGYFGLRFLLAYGPDVPDGFLDLDAVETPDDGPEKGQPREQPGLEAGAPAGYVAFSESPGAPPLAWFRNWEAAAAAARDFVAAARLEPRERLVTLLAQDDHRGLTTGMMAALAAGCPCEAHGLFDSATMVESLNSGGPVRLVAPGWMEADLARLDFPGALSGVVLVHEAPVRFKAHTPLSHGVVDALAFGEIAVLAQARDARGRFALSLDRSADIDGSLAVRRDEEGRIQFRGLAAAAAPLDGRAPPAQDDDWRDSGFVAEVFAGIVIGVNQAP
jgi:mycobactin salicyl-AMP ligase